MKYIPGIFSLASLPIVFSVALGQLPSVRFDRLYPPSAKQGAEVELKIAGADLEDLKWIKFSHDSLKAEPKKTDDGEIVPNVFLLKVAANAPLGIHKAWIGGGKFGASNYRTFVVSDLLELEAGAGGTSMEKPFLMELGQTALGKLTAGKYAWFQFAAKKGQRILVEVSTKDIESKLLPSLALYDPQRLQVESDPQSGLLDFTPSVDGNYSVRLNDFIFKGGLDYVYRLSVSTRPRIDMVYPPVGKAGTNAKFTLYGRNLPGGQPSDWKTKDGKVLEKKDVQIQLPSGDARAKLNLTDYLDPRRASLDHLEYRLKSPQGTSVAAYVGYGSESLVYEAAGDNDIPEKAQKVNVPCEFVGKFYPAADKDRLRFTAKKGDVFRMEVFSERLGRPSHAFLLLEQLTKKDDAEETSKEIGQSLETASTLGGKIFDVSTRDPSLRFVAPADGDYRILVYDLFNSTSDPLNVYRLSVRKETPDFRLAAYGLLPPPASTNSSPVFVKSPTIRKGETFPVKVMVLRRDGFKDAIDLEVTGLPPFVSYTPKRVPEGADSVTMLFQPSAKATDWDGLFSIAGKSKVGGKDVRRDCRFADVCWSSYDTGSKLTVSHVHVVQRSPLAVVGREDTPVKVVIDDAKLAETAKKAFEAAEKTSQEADKKVTDVQTKLKAPVDAETKADQELVLKKKEMADKEKVRADLADNRLKAAKEKLTQTNAAMTKADAERKAADAAQKTSTAEVAKAKASYDASEKAAKAAEALSATVRNDANKPAPEKQKAKQDADAKRKAATADKSAHDKLIATKLNPANQKLAASDKTLTTAKAGKDAAAKEVARLEAELKKATQEVAAVTAALKQAEQKATTAKAAARKARLDLMSAKAAQVGRKSELEDRRTKLAAANKRKDNPSNEPRVFETAVSGVVKIPIKLASTDSFNAQTKVKLYGHAAVAKIKEITIDPKKKNEGTLDLNLASAKLPVGEFPLFCSAQVKGKYKIFSDEEAKVATEEAKKVDDMLKAAKTVAADALKAVAEAKKKLDEAKKAKDEAKVAAAEKVSMAAAERQKDADSKVKGLDAKKKKADAIAKKKTDASKKPKDLTVTLFTNPFTLKVRDVPVEMSPLEKRTVKAGEKVNLDVAIKRLFGFADQVTLKVVLPSEAKGITVKASNIAKDAYAGSLELATNAASTAAGEFECKLEGTLKFNNQNLKFTETFVLKVDPAPAKKSG